jgi:hypothetical protein
MYAPSGPTQGKQEAVMTKTFALIAAIAAASALSLSALAQDEPAAAQPPSKAECEQAAAAQNFGIHLSERHRFVLRCAAGLPQR